MAALSSAKRIVVKIGSALLVDRDTGELRAGWLHSLANDVAWLKSRGTDVVLVSSGSIALGRGVLGLPRADLPLEKSQAAAAVGQIRLARAYEEALAPHRITTAQVLVTLEDSENRRRYLNSRATLETLLSMSSTMRQLPAPSFSSAQRSIGADRYRPSFRNPFRYSFGWLDRMTKSSGSPSDVSVLKRVCP